ncbi:MAG: hypothetical protein RLZZ535_2884 [Cyanobacteriota bacterium]|jgi:hypothetical protein
MKTMQLGLKWFPERQGGLDRYYYDCCQYLPQADIKVTSLLAGLEKVVQDSNGLVTAFASPKIFSSNAGSK